MFSSMSTLKSTKSTGRWKGRRWTDLKWGVPDQSSRPDPGAGTDPAAWLQPICTARAVELLAAGQTTTMDLGCMDHAPGE